MYQDIVLLYLNIILLYPKSFCIWLLHICSRCCSSVSNIVLLYPILFFCIQYCLSVSEYCFSVSNVVPLYPLLSLDIYIHIYLLCPILFLCIKILSVCIQSCNLVFRNIVLLYPSSTLIIECLVVERWVVQRGKYARGDGQSSFLSYRSTLRASCSLPQGYRDKDGILVGLYIIKDTETRMVSW